MQRFAILIAAVAVTVALPSAAQAPGPLPSTLSGRWTVVPPGGRAIIDTWSIRFEGNGAPGPVKGLVTWRGRGCGALNEPATGNWDGTELRFEFKARPDVNTQLMGATYCGEGKTIAVLRRTPGARDFEGTASLNDAPTGIQITGSP